jgi:hypothetical protein
MQNTGQNVFDYERIGNERSKLPALIPGAHSINLKMRSIVAGILLLVLAGCSSTKAATMLDASVPMRQQSIIDPDYGIEVISIDGERVKGGSWELYIPSGPHELMVGVNAQRQLSYGTWLRFWTKPGEEIRFSRDFEAGHIYKILIKAEREASEPVNFEGITFYHEGGYRAWLEIEDATGVSKWDPVPVGLGARGSGVLTNWDRPAGFYFQSAGFAGLYFGYHNVTEFGDYAYQDPANKPPPYYSGAVGGDFQLGFETGYRKFGMASLIDFSVGLGLDGDVGFRGDDNIGFMEFLYYDKIIGLGFGAGLWNGVGGYIPTVPYYRGQLSVFPTTGDFTHDISLYFDYFPRDKIWGVGIKWAPYLWGQPISGTAGALR